MENLEDSADDLDDYFKVETRKQRKKDPQFIVNLKSTQYERAGRNA